MAEKKLEYWQLLRDPRWQRKRLEVMEAAGFACVNCGETKETLNVHHRHYVKGAMPWEYADEDLQCLCEKCHEDITGQIQRLKVLAGKMGAGVGLLIGFAGGELLKACELDNFAPQDYAEVEGLAISMYRDIAGFRFQGFIMDPLLNAADSKTGVDLDTALRLTIEGIADLKEWEAKQQGAEEMPEGAQ